MSLAADITPTGGPAAEKTLLDEFAGLAMQADLLASGLDGDYACALAEEAEEHSHSIEQRIAINAYDMAAWMLKARPQ